MKKFCTCFLLSMFPIPGFAAVHTDAYRPLEVMDHLLPFFIIEQGSDNRNNSFFSTVCNGQLQSLSLSGGVNVVSERDGRSRGNASMDDSYNRPTPPEVSRKYDALLRPGEIEIAVKHKLNSSSVDGFFIVPAAPYTLNGGGNNAACLAELVP